MTMTRWMTLLKRTATVACAAAPVFLAACGGNGDISGEVIKKIPVDSSTEVISRKNVSTDPGISADGKGSLKIAVSGTQTLNLYKLGDIDLEEAFLVYSAAIRTEDLDGEVFLEMKVFFSTKGEFFSRNFESALSGTNDWTVMSTPFKLRAGENPDMVELNIYVTGRGTVWIDDIRVLKRPLN
jgi:hypothetical protein